MKGLLTDMAQPRQLDKRAVSIGGGAGVCLPLFVIIRAVTRLILLLAVCGYVRAESMEDAARALGKRVLARLAPEEAARVSARNLTSLPASDTAKAQVALDRTLRRRLRNPVFVDVSLTISENLHGYLLVAETRRENGTMVDMVEHHPDPPAAQVRPQVALDKKLLWEQPAPILDLTLLDDQLLLLDTARIARYERNTAKWELKESYTLPQPVNVRDPRGRLEISGESLSAEVPGLSCKGTWKPALNIQCEDGGRFSPYRNTIDLHDGHAPFFQSAEIGPDYLIAETDGRTHIYDGSNNSAGAFDDWGADFVPVADSCRGSYVAAASPADRKSADSVALYALVNRTPARVSDLLELPGPVTALWPLGAGAMAVVRNLSTGSYAAYALSMDCGR